MGSDSCRREEGRRVERPRRGVHGEDGVACCLGAAERHPRSLWHPEVEAVNYSAPTKPPWRRRWERVFAGTLTVRRLDEILDRAQRVWSPRG